jgi:hypothetical protein
LSLQEKANFEKDFLAFRLMCQHCGVS